MKIHFPLLALVAVVVLSQHNVDANLLDQLLMLRREGEQVLPHFRKTSSCSLDACNGDTSCFAACINDGINNIYEGYPRPSPTPQPIPRPEQSPRPRPKPQSECKRNWCGTDCSKLRKKGKRKCNKCKAIQECVDGDTPETEDNQIAMADWMGYPQVDVSFFNGRLRRRMEELEEKTESLDGFGYRRLGSLYQCTRRGDKDCAKSGCFQALKMIKRMQKEVRDMSINNICKMAVEDGQISGSFESACRYMARNHPQTSCKMAGNCNCIKQTPASAGGGFGRL